MSVSWGEAVSIFIDPEDFEELARVLLGEEADWGYERNGADGIYKFWTDNGTLFLDRVRDCKAAVVTGAFKMENRKDARRCLGNLKAIEPQWRQFVDSHNYLQIWVDEY